ncbi:hypothetical protein D3C78_193540 [compost metagenome]
MPIFLIRLTATTQQRNNATTQQRNNATKSLFFVQNLFIFLKLIHQSAFRAIQLDFSSVKGRMFTSLEAKHLIDIRSYVLTTFSFLSLISKKNRQMAIFFY